jgi:hypothetical protein
MLEPPAELLRTLDGLRLAWVWLRGCVAELR